MYIIPIKSFFLEDDPSQDELLSELTEPVIKANHHSGINNHILGVISLRKLPGNVLFFDVLYQH